MGFGLWVCVYKEYSAGGRDITISFRQCWPGSLTTTRRGKKKKKKKKLFYFGGGPGYYDILPPVLTGESDDHPPRKKKKNKNKKKNSFISAGGRDIMISFRHCWPGSLTTTRREKKKKKKNLEFGLWVCVYKEYLAGGAGYDDIHRPVLTGE